MKTRNQIPAQYKWNPSDLVENLETAQNRLKKIREQSEKISSYRGKLGNKNDLLEFLNFTTSIGEELQRIAVFSHIKHSENMEDNTYIKFNTDITNVDTDMSSAEAFVEPELLAYGDEYLNDVMNDTRFKNYAFYFKELLRNKVHVLPEEQEKLVNEVGRFTDFNDIFDSYDAVDVKFDDIVVDGKKYPLTTSNYILYLENKNREIRRQAFKNFYKGYMSMQNTIATNYIASVKADIFFAKTYKYKGSLEASLSGNNLPESVYLNLIKNVDKNVKLLHQYCALNKKLLGLKDYTHFDFFANPIKSTKKYTYEQMKENVVEALKPLGDDYVDVVRIALAGGWIDVYPTKNKDTGGYCIDAYGVHPYILLNTVDNIDSMFTLIHEMGHAMHSHYSNTTQPFTLCGYPIFLAEIASTTNEVLLIKHLYAKATTKQEKMFLLNKYLLMFSRTLFRQTMFSEFEYFAHQKVEKGEALSKDVLVEYYGNLNKKYHGKAVKHCKEIEFEWTRIPHFYRNFYVYKYATGITSAIVLASNILNEKEGALQKYREFLCAGGSDYPYEILKRAGVDLAKDDAYEIAFGEMQWALKEFKKCME